MIFLVICTIACIAGSVSTQSCSFVSQYQRTLSGGYSLQWRIDDNQITIKIIARTTGWVGFGLSPSGTMAQADILMAGVDDGGRGYVLDTFAWGNGRPSVDADQNWNGVSFAEFNGFTTVVASRALKTGDLRDRDITNGELFILWAYNPTRDVIGGVPRYQHSFTTRGATRIELIPNRGTPGLEMSTRGMATPMTTPTSMMTPGTVTRLPNVIQTTPTVNTPTPAQVRYSTNFAQGMKLEWYYTGDEITFELSAPTTGWIGIGFSPGTNMINADLIVVGENADGTDYVYDLYSLWNGPPITQEKQDVTLISVSNISGNTEATFKRKLNTGDARDRTITAGNMNVLWAYGNIDASGSDQYLLTYHAQRGHKVVELLQSA